MKDLVSDGFAQVVKPYIDAQDKTTREILAPVEADETDASRAYQIGDQLILGGILYDVIAPISQHGIITSTGSGANIEEADNITEQIGSVNSALTNLDAEVTNVENILVAKNLMPNNATTQVINGVTYTVRPNSTANYYLRGTVKAVRSSTSSDNAWITLVENLVLPRGSYILSGCPSGGSTNSYLLAFDTDIQTTTLYESGDGLTFTVTDDEKIRVRIRCASTFDGEVVFYPMIRPASVEDDTYVPHAKTNWELSNYETLSASGITSAQSRVSIAASDMRIEKLSCNMVHLFGYINITTGTEFGNGSGHTVLLDSLPFSTKVNQYFVGSLTNTALSHNSAPMVLLAVLGNQLRMSFNVVGATASGRIYCDTILTL